MAGVLSVVTALAMAVPAHAVEVVQDDPVPTMPAKGHKGANGPVALPQVSFDPGWITGTIYWNRTETGYMADYSWWAAYSCTVIAGWNFLAGIACQLAAPRLAFAASTARAHGNCVGLRFYFGNPAVWWTVEHNGSRC